METIVVHNLQELTLRLLVLIYCMLRPCWGFLSRYLPAEVN